jgi:hypothetical protein
VCIAIVLGCVGFELIERVKERLMFGKKREK